MIRGWLGTTTKEAAAILAATARSTGGRTAAGVIAFATVSALAILLIVRSSNSDSTTDLEVFADRLFEAVEDGDTAHVVAALAWPDSAPSTREEAERVSSTSKEILGIDAALQLSSVSVALGTDGDQIIAARLDGNDLDAEVELVVRRTPTGWEVVDFRVIRVHRKGR